MSAGEFHPPCSIVDEDGVCVRLNVIGFQNLDYYIHVRLTSVFSPRKNCYFQKDASAVTNRSRSIQYDESKSLLFVICHVWVRLILGSRAAPAAWQSERFHQRSCGGCRVFCRLLRKSARHRCYHNIRWSHSLLRRFPTIEFSVLDIIISMIHVNIAQIAETRSS